MHPSRPIRQDFTLSGQGIDEAVAQIAAYLDGQFADKSERLRIRLSAEECLLDWQGFLGADAAVTLDCRHRLGRPSVRLSAKGPRYREEPDSEPSLSDKVMAEAALCPQHRYSGGVNVTTFYLPRRPVGVGVRVLIGAFLGLICGFAAKAALPAQTCTDIASIVLSPLFDTLLGIISMLAGPLIFLCIFCGISGSTNMESFRRVGKMALLGNFGWAFLGLILSFAVAVPVFGMSVRASGATTGGPGEVISLFLGIVPGNLVEPFAKGNTLQIIVLAVVFGVVALKLGDAAAHVVALANQFKQIISSLMSWSVTLLPVLVFLTLTQNILEDSVAPLLGCWLPFVVAVAVTLLVTVVHVVVSARRMHRSLGEVVSAIAPVTGLAFATASSSSVFADMLVACKKRLGVPGEMADVCVPLGVILSRFSSVVEFAVITCYFAAQAGLQTSLAWFIILGVSAFLMSFALPPIPGGALAVINALFLQMGLSSDAIAIAMVLDVGLDFFVTAAAVAAALSHAGEIAARCAQADAQGGKAGRGGRR